MQQAPASNQHVQQVQVTYQGQSTEANFATDQSIYITNLPKVTTHEILYYKLTNEFNVDPNQINKFKIKIGNQDKARASIEFKTKDYAEKVVKDINGKLFINQYMGAVIKRSKESIKSSKNYYFKIVKNPDNEEIDSQKMYQYFSQFGDIISIKLAYSRQQFSGYGYVSFDSSISNKDNVIAKLQNEKSDILKLGDKSNLEVSIQIFQSQKNRQNEKKNLHMINFTSAISDSEWKTLQSEQVAMNKKLTSYESMIADLLKEFKNIKVVVTINSQIKKPQVFINEIVSDDEQNKIKDILEKEFKAQKPEIIKSGKFVSIILLGLKKDCKPEDLVKVLEEEYGKIKKFKTKNNEEISLQVTAPNSSDPETKTTSSFTIFTFVDQNNNEKFIMGYQTNEKLNQFKEKVLSATFKLSKKDFNQVKQLKEKTKSFFKPAASQINNENAQASAFTLQQFPMQLSQPMNVMQYYQQPQQQYSMPAPRQQQQYVHRYGQQQFNPRSYNGNQQQQQQTRYNLQQGWNRIQGQQGTYPQQKLQGSNQGSNQGNNQGNAQIIPKSFSTPASIPGQQQMSNPTMQQNPQRAPNVQPNVEFTNYEQLKANVPQFMLLTSQKKQQVLGQLLYPLIQKQTKSEPSIVSKITGMLIDFSVFEVSDIFEFFENEQELKERIDEARQLIQQSTAQPQQGQKPQSAQGTDNVEQKW